MGLVRKKRTKIPPDVARDILHASRHTCCHCRVPRLPVEIHHINEDPSDHRWENLAVLCRNCHGIISNKGPLGRRYSQGEVRKLKREWEERCASGELDDEPELEDHEVTKVASGRDVSWTYALSCGDVLVVSIDSDVAVDVTIARESDYRRWCNGEDTDINEENVDAYECTLTFEAPSDNRYVVWISHEEDEDAVVEVDTTIWNADEGEEDEDENDDADKAE
jgi:hypothetical protein